MVDINPSLFWESIGLMNNARDSFLIRPDEESYWQSGKIDADKVFTKAQEHGQKSFEVILEYGCGDGRIARFMSANCDTLICVDIAKSVLELAYKQLNNRFGINNVLYKVAYECGELKDTADFIYSMQVIQHNPPDEQKNIIQNIYRFLKPGGLACVHFAALETKPDYQNCNSCMCFTREQVEELAAVFDNYEITLENFGGASEEDYFVWGNKNV